MCANNLQYRNPQLRLLSDSQVDEIKIAALHIMEKTGVAFDTCPQALEILGDAGADISDPKKVKIPPHMVEQAFRTAPEAITIYNREGKVAFTLNGLTGPHFGGSDGGPDYPDPRTGERRQCYVEDIDDMARLIDALPNLEWTMTASTHPTVPGSIADMVVLLHVMMNSSKPVGVSINSVDGLKEMLQVCSLVAGGEKALRDKPFFIGSSEPVTPLTQEKDAMECSLLCAENGIPNIVYSMPMAGSTAPASFPAVLAICNAEVLSQLVVLQLKNPGTPVIFGSIPNVMDMRTCIFPYGAPELSFLVAALTEICHSYRLPMFGTAGCTDAAMVDAQVGAEVTYQILMTALSGADLVHDIGVMHWGRLFSPALHVFSDEVIGMAKVSTGGMEVNEETLAVDLIEKVGPRGNFISEKHTLKYFRKFWVPTIFDRSVTKEGAKTCDELLKEKTVRIMDTYQPKPLPDDIVKELIAIEKRWFKQADADYPYPKLNKAS